MVLSRFDRLRDKHRTQECRLDKIIADNVRQVQSANRISYCIHTPKASMQRVITECCNK